MHFFYYLALVCIIHTYIVNGVRAPRGYERRKKSVEDPAPSQNLTLKAVKSGSPSTNGTITATPSSTLKNTKNSAPSSNLKGQTASKHGPITEKISSMHIAVTGPITKIPVLLTTTGSGAETVAGMQSVNFYLQVGIAIYFLMLQF